MAADEALPQMDPGVAHLQAFLAAFAAGFYLPYLSQVGAGFSWTRHFVITSETLLAHACLVLLSRVFQKSFRFECRHAA